ncbi:MAG TPA: GDP-L-fucose synthase [Mycobacteriales bacterium]|jgi:GDP-L-fucose synthase|nr:GDP-L-fucose synthase [Mycobacteriales bacterium]
MPPRNRDEVTWVAGHRGLVGSALWRHLHDSGFTRLVATSSREVDLRDRDATFAYVRTHRPRTAVIAAARVGGILANATQPAEFLSDNLRIQVNVMDAAATYEVEKLLFLGSSCIYPKLAPQPIPEAALLTGELEPTNDAYAIAKIAGILQVQAVRRQYGLPWIAAMPTNLYGRGDNFSPTGSHVLPGMLRRFHEAKLAGDPVVTNWGSGAPRREFLHVDDLARACLLLLDSYDDARPINVGTGSDLTIRELAELIAGIVGFSGEVRWDPSKPDGTPRKVLDVSRLRALGFTPQISLEDGIRDTYSWFRQAAEIRN